MFMNRYALPIAASVLALLGLACSQPAQTETAPPPSINDLGWMAGHWCGDQAGARIEEHWFARGDKLLALAVTMQGGKLLGFEYTRIESRSDGLAFVAQPDGAAPTVFKLTDSRHQRADFGNPEHDFPQRISYWRDDQGLHAQIAGPGDGGVEKRIDFHFSACVGN